MANPYRDEEIYALHGWHYYRHGNISLDTRIYAQREYEGGT